MVQLFFFICIYNIFIPCCYIFMYFYLLTGSWLHASQGHKNKRTYWVTATCLLLSIFIHTEKKHSRRGVFFQPNITQKHARIQKVLSEGVQQSFFVCFSLMRGGMIQIPFLAGHQRPTSKTPFKWRFAGRPMMAQH